MRSKPPPKRNTTHQGGVPFWRRWRDSNSRALLRRLPHFESFPPCDFWWKLSEDGSTQRKPKSCGTGTLITNLLLDESLPDTNEFIQKIGSVDLIPSSRSLTVAEANLLMTPDSNDYLAALLNPLRLSYDYIIVDTNPSLGSLTINALTAADEVIIPIDPELFALTGLQALVDTIKKIKRKLNPSIEIGGILFTKCNKRTNLYRRTYGQVTKAFQSLPIFNCQIPYTVKVGDANS